MARLHKKRRILAAQLKEAEEAAVKVAVVEEAPAPVAVAPVENNSVVKKVVEKVTKKKV